MLKEIMVGEVNGVKLIEVSYSELQCFLRCSMKHHYKYIKNLERKTKDLPLERGSVLHLCLKSLYSTGEWKPAHKEYKKQFAKLFDEEKELYGDLPAEVFRLMRGYYNCYKGDLNWKVLGVEVPFKCRLPNSRVVVTGIIDLVVEDKMGIWIVEHKTHKEIPSHDYRMMEIQPTLYFYPVDLHFGSNLARGIIYNYIRTKSPTVPQLLKNGSLSRKKIDTDLATFKATIKKHNLNPDDYTDVLERLSYKSFFKRVRLPRPDILINNVIREAIITGHLIEYYKERRVLPARTILKSCQFDCEYQPICWAELHGHDVEYIMSSQYQQRQEVRSNKGKREEKEAS
jgi:hypothetical protein